MMKGVLGSASTHLQDGTVVGALVVVNALGDIIDPRTSQVVAGARGPLGGMINSHVWGNTTIAVVATSAHLTKVEANKMAQMAHNGLAQVIRPAHTMFDGDSIFALSLGSADQQPLTTALMAQRISLLGSVAADTLARAIVKAVRHAQELCGVPAAGSEQH